MEKVKGEFIIFACFLRFGLNVIISKQPSCSGGRLLDLLVLLAKFLIEDMLILFEENYASPNAFTVLDGFTGLDDQMSASHVVDGKEGRCPTER